MPSITLRTYASRAAAHPVPVAKQLLECMDRKQTNLCVSVDVTKKADLLRIANASGPYICCVKVRQRSQGVLGVAKEAVADGRGCVFRRPTSISSKISIKISFNNFKLSQRSTISSFGKTANSLISVCTIFPLETCRILLTIRIHR